MKLTLVYKKERKRFVLAHLQAWLIHYLLIPIKQRATVRVYQAYVSLESNQQSLSQANPLCYRANVSQCRYHPLPYGDAVGHYAFAQWIEMFRHKAYTS